MNTETVGGTETMPYLVQLISGPILSTEIEFIKARLQREESWDLIAEPYDTEGRTQVLHGKAVFEMHSTWILNQTYSYDLTRCIHRIIRRLSAIPPTTAVYVADPEDPENGFVNRITPVN